MNVLIRFTMGRTMAANPPRPFLATKPCRASRGFTDDHRHWLY